MMIFRHVQTELVFTTKLLNIQIITARVKMRKIRRKTAPADCRGGLEINLGEAITQRKNWFRFRRFVVSLNHVRHWIQCSFRTSCELFQHPLFEGQ